MSAVQNTQKGCKFYEATGKVVAKITYTYLSGFMFEGREYTQRLHPHSKYTVKHLRLKYLRLKYTSRYFYIHLTQLADFFFQRFRYCEMMRRGEFSN